MLKIDEVSTLDLGHQGENLAKTIDIDVSEWLLQYPNANINIVVLRSGDTTPYIANTTVANGVLSWVLTSSDTELAGIGRAEVRATVEGLIKKSTVIMTKVKEGLLSIPPTPAPSWVNEVIEKGNEVLNSQAEVFEIDEDGHLIETNVAGEESDLGKVVGDKGDKGDTGSTGNGISSISKTSTVGNVDTYTITYTNGITTTFTVTNGIDGDDGVGISSISKTSTSGDVDTYTITFTNGTTTTFTVTNGTNGEDGDDGISVSNATINNSGHLIITLSNGTTIDTGNVVPTIDQTYSATSTNAQSGVAVAQAVNELNANIDNINLLVKKGNLLNRATSLGNKIMSLDGSNVVFYDNASYITYKIPVFIADYNKYYISWRNGGVSARVAFFDLNNNYIANSYKNASINEETITQDGFMYLCVGIGVSNELCVSGGNQLSAPVGIYLDNKYPSIKLTEVESDLTKISELYTETGNGISHLNLKNKILSIDGTQVVEYDLNDYRLTDFIFLDKSKSTTYYINGSGAVRYALYDLNKTYIQGTYTQPSLPATINIPDSCFIKISVNLGSVYNINLSTTINDTTVPYEILLKKYVKPQFSIIDNFAKGKKIGVFGDSITHGYTMRYDGDTLIGSSLTKKWYQYVIERYSISSNYNNAQVGRCFSIDGSESTRFTSVITNVPADCDIIMLFGGTNDFMRDVPLGALDDEKSNANGATFYAAVKYCAWFFSVAYPNTKIIFMTPIQRHYTYQNESFNKTNGVGKKLVDYCNAIIDVCKAYGINYIDMQKDSEFHVASDNWLKTYMCDGLHPTQLGTELYVKNCIFPALDKIFNINNFKDQF